MPKAPVFILLLMTGLAFAAPAGAGSSAITLPRNLEQLSDRAAVIVRGTVTSARVEKHPVFRELDTVVVNLHVSDRLKGRVGDTWSFRQFIWDVRARDAAGGYRKGQDLLLFLIAPNAQGLSSPAGQEQGRFRIHRDRDGREMAVNGHGNLRLFDGVAESAQKSGVGLSARSQALAQRRPSGPVELGDLTALVRELVAARN